MHTDRSPVSLPVEVLLVSPSDEDHCRLDLILRLSYWLRLEARTLREAMDVLSAHPNAVVISESRLPDGDWKDLHNHMPATSDLPILIVASRLADERLWSEVLNLGAYNVLAKPFDSQEVLHVLNCASRLRHSPWSHGNTHAMAAA